jgi:four helix bundle protein
MACISSVSYWPDICNVLQMMAEKKTKQYDLESRTFKYSKSVIQYIKKLPKTLTNIEISKQLMRSAGSVGANYIEANEALGKKDFLMRIRICRKEAKESRYWLGLSSPVPEETDTRKNLINESTELTKIFGSIVTKANTSHKPRV